jgi:hypothetical protein
MIFHHFPTQKTGGQAIQNQLGDKQRPTTTCWRFRRRKLKP